MAKQIFTDAFGNEIEVDDTITALGPSPNLIGTSAESGFDYRFQRISDPYGDRQRAREREARRNSGYGNGDPTGTVDDSDWTQQHFNKGNL